MEEIPKSNEDTAIDRVLLPFRLFAAREASGGVLLLIATIVALAWANSPWKDVYHHLWESLFTIGLEDFNVSKPLHVWINDGLMAMFFFVVGLEIKREFIAGELASVRHALLPIAAALGGMLVPALIYVAFNAGTPSAHGWGVPMATDIAFALAILALLGDRVPAALKLFLTALAIVDDLGAVIIIALFYTSNISVPNLAIGALFLLILFSANKFGLRNWIFYALFGIGGVWLSFLLAGVHPTIAGVLAAFAIPARTKIDSNQFVATTSDIIQVFRRPEESKKVLIGKERLSALLRLKVAYEDAVTPLQRLEKALHPWVAFLVLPIFALANAGVELNVRVADVLFEPVTLGIVFGLIFGKLIGITFFTWIVVATGWCSLPPKVRWIHIIGTAILAGMGFTMSLFITTLAFSDSAQIASAKLAILGASTIAGLAGWVILRYSLKRPVAAKSSLPVGSKIGASKAIRFKSKQ